MNAERLREKNRNSRVIQAAAPVVECVTRGQNQRHDGLAASELAKFRVYAWKNRFAGTGPDHQQQLCAEIADQPRKVDAECRRDWPQHEYDEQPATDVKMRDQPP